MNKAIARSHQGMVCEIYHDMDFLRMAGVMKSNFLWLDQALSSRG
jgi:hypothetical protein